MWPCSYTLQTHTIEPGQDGPYARDMEYILSRIEKITPVSANIRVWGTFDEKQALGPTDTYIIDDREELRRYAQTGLPDVQPVAQSDIDEAFQVASEAFGNRKIRGVLGQLRERFSDVGSRIDFEDHEHLVKGTIQFGRGLPLRENLTDLGYTILGLSGLAAMGYGIKNSGSQIIKDNNLEWTTHMLLFVGAAYEILLIHNYMKDMRRIHGTKYLETTLWPAQFSRRSFAKTREVYNALRGK